MERVVRQAKQDLEDTRNTLAADQKFLMNLKETCQMTDAESDESETHRASGYISFRGIHLETEPSCVILAKSER